MSIEVRTTTLDVLHTGVQSTVDGFYTGDVGEKVLQISLTKGDAPYEPPQDSIAVLYTQKPDGTFGMYDCSIAGNVVTVSPSQQVLSVAGNVRCQIEIIRSNNSLLYCPEFILSVAQAVQQESGVESSDEFATLERLIVEANRVLRKRVVDELPQEDDEDEIVYLVGSGFYRFDGEDWIPLTKDELTTIETTEYGVLSLSGEAAGNFSVSVGTMHSGVRGEYNLHIELDGKAYLRRWNDANNTWNLLYSVQLTPTTIQTLDKISEQDGQILFNGKRIRVETVQTLPQSGASGDVVYLTGEGLYRYDDGWNKLTDDDLEQTVAALSDDVDALQSAMPTAQDKTAWNSAAEDAHTHANKTALDAITAAKTASWDAAYADKHTHANKTALDTITAAKTANWDAAYAAKHMHNNKTALDAITAAKTANWDAAYTDKHTHANKTALDGLSAPDGVLLLNGQAVGIEVVDTVPEPVKDKIILNYGHLYYGRQRNGTTNWVAIADHAHYNKSVIDKIAEQGGRMLFDGKTVVTETPDDVTLLALEAYDALYLRDDFTGIGTLDDVPIYVLDNVGYGFGLYEDESDPSNCDCVSVGEVWDDDTGLPVRFIRARRSGTNYARWSRDCTVDGNAFLRGVWYTNNTATDAPSFAGFTPTALEVCGEWYDDLSDLPDKAASALCSLSQLVNVSSSAMGTIRVPENAVQRFAGAFQKNKKYAFRASEDMTVSLPTMPWSDEDAQFVLYLTCAADIDVSFPTGTLFVGGTAPNTDTGVHKIIGSSVSGVGAWMIGGIDYEVPT